MDCFVASAFARRRASADKSAPRNDVDGQESAFSRLDPPEVCPKVSRLEIRGRGECRMRAAPAVSCAKLCKKTHSSIQVQRRQSDIPCAMVLRPISRSPRRSGWFDTVACEYGCQSPVGMTGLRKLDANH